VLPLKFSTVIPIRERVTTLFRILTQASSPIRIASPKLPRSLSTRLSEMTLLAFFAPPWLLDVTQTAISPMFLTMCCR